MHTIPHTTRNIVRFLEEAMETSSETAPFLAEIDADEGLHYMFSPFAEGYRQAIWEARKAIRTSPDISSEQLLEQLRVAQGEFDDYLTTAARGLLATRGLIEWEYASRLGFQVVLTLLARTIPTMASWSRQQACK